LDLFDNISKAERDGDMKLKAKLKTQLFYIVPAVDIVEGLHRKYDNIEHFNGILPLDFDHIDNAEEFRDYIVDEYDFVIAAWLSASKKGIKALVSIPVVSSPDEYKELFWGLANNVMMKYKGFDIATQNSVLPLFLSPDPNIRLATSWTQWTTKGKNPKLAVKIPKKVYKYSYDNIDKYKRWCVNNVQKAIDKIIDNGHPQLRAAAYLMGGYVGQGYLDEFEAKSIINQMIYNNAYLNAKPAVYIRTASEMIGKGQNEPVEL
jgi:hypothetical protein